MYSIAIETPYVYCTFGPHLSPIIGLRLEARFCQLYLPAKGCVIPYTILYMIYPFVAYVTSAENLVENRNNCVNPLQYTIRCMELQGIAWNYVTSAENLVERP